MQPNRSAAYVTRVHLENVRGFADLTLDLASDGPRQHAIIGRNGTCKTTLLRCIALALCDMSDASALLAGPNGSLVREGQDMASIAVELSNGVESTLRIRREGDKDVVLAAHHGTHPIAQVERAGDRLPFVCGYGLDRMRQGSEFGRSWRAYDSVSTLFQPGSLVDSELVLRRLQDWLGDDTYTDRLRVVRQALGLPKAQFSFAKGGGVRVSGPGIGDAIPLEALADGYRLTFAWMLDFLGWAMRAGALDDVGNVTGILLVDEIEQHLHPEMQGGLLERLGKLMPQVQVICTTHSPLVALGAAPGHLVALHRKGKTISARDPGDLTAYSAEDALVADALFGTDPYAPHTQRKLDARDKLATVEQTQRSAAQSAKLKGIAEDLHESAVASMQDDPVLRQILALKESLLAEAKK